MVIGSKCYWVDWERQLEPKWRVAQHSNSHGQLVRRPHEVRNWSCQRMGCTSCLIFINKERNNSFHPFKRDKSSWSTIFKLLQHLQLISALHLTGNHEFWCCSRNRLLNNSLKTIGSSHDASELGRCDKKTHDHVHSGPKRTQGVAPRPRPMKVLLSLCGSDLRSVVWWRGVSPEI